MDLTQGKIGQKILFFALPIMFSNLLQQFYNTADAIIVGRFVGSDALAAVGASSLLITFLIYFFIGLSVGASVLISQFYGADDTKRLSITIHTDVALALLSGVILTIVGVLFAKPMLQAMNLPESGMSYAKSYLQIYSISMVPFAVYNVGSGILRALGDSKTPLYCLIMTVTLNVVMDVFFVAIMSWEVTGAAWASTISQLAAAVFIIFKLNNLDEAFRLKIRNIHFDFLTLKEIIRIGVPTGIQSVLVCFSNVVVQAQINTFGIDVMAGFTAYMKVDGFLFMPIDAFSLAISNFTGQNIGAGNVERVQKGKNICLIFSIGVTVVIGIIMLFSARFIIGAFSSTEEVIEHGIRQLYLVVPLYFIYASNQTYIGVLRGAGATFVPMVISLICMCGLRIGWIFVLKQFVLDPLVIYISYPLTWIVTGSILFVYYYFGKWKPQIA